MALNGRPVVNLARLLPDGQVDLSFAALSIDGVIRSLALQADGKILVGGDFLRIGGQSRIGIARLLPDGTLDPGFLSPFGGNPPPFTYSNVTKIAVQPGRGVVVLGSLLPPGSTGPGIVYAARLLEATGARDPTFQPGFNTFGTEDVLALPNGHLIFAGQSQPLNGQPCTVWSTLPDGALDPSFSSLATGLLLSRALARDPATNKIYVGAGTAGQGLQFEPVRLLPDGTVDPTFSTAGTFAASGTGTVYSLAVQPNGRVLLGGGFSTASGGYYGSVRLLPSGALDTSYDPSRGPLSNVRKVLVQPDGALVFAGEFSQVQGLPVSGLTRLLDANVLSAHAPAQAEELHVWPVPAREVLHLRLPAARAGRELTLLDGLGRVVARQAVGAGEAAPALPVAGLPAGSYVLRVAFAQGPPAYRRVAVE